MVFNSIHFVGFFLVVYGLYRILPHRAQNWLLLAASYYFYAAWDWRFLGLLIASTTLDFFAGLMIARATSPARRRAWLLASLVFNLGMLGFFKYFNFFASSLQQLLASVGWQADFVTLHIILPIGISFYTFMTISYVVDVYRGDFEPTSNFIDFAVFVAFFPHLVAGPILRASKLLPQIASPRVITSTQIRDGLWLVAWGFFQKLFVADNLGHIVEVVYGASATPTGVDVLIGTYAFAFQIYGDFAGYSNIARGISKLMGIELSINFLFPYFVLTPREFWRHWHISLSTWLRDYLYIPLGGSRGSEWRTGRNLLITMVLGGLWHGAAWTFVLWGTYQGLVLVLDRWLIGDRLQPGQRPRLWPLTAVAWLVMFHVTCFGWLIFRSGSIEHLAALMGALLLDFTVGPETFSYAALLAAYAGPLMAIHLLEAYYDDLLAVFRLPSVWRYAVYGSVFYLTLLFGDFGGAQFIYFQF